MRTIVVLVVTLIAATCHAASGSVFFKRLYGSTLAGEPDRRTIAQYMSGVEVRERFRWVEPYVQVVTRMDQRYSDGSFHPTSVEYRVGALIRLRLLDVRLERMCWHPVDTNGPVEQYWGVEVRWSWR